MGLFDLFKGEKKKGGSPSAKWADRLTKRAQNYDRQEAIQALAEMGSSDAVELLLKRFTFHVDPSITDQEEKESAFRGILRADREAIEPVRAFAAKAESLAWPMKIMKELLVDEQAYAEELLRWLSRWITGSPASASRSSGSSRTSTSPRASTPPPPSSRKTTKARPLRCLTCWATRRACVFAAALPKAWPREAGRFRKTSATPSARAFRRRSRWTTPAVSSSAEPGQPSGPDRREGAVKPERALRSTTR
jgi:hypothetical protein